MLSHLARNADGLVNLLTWARTGVETPMYAGHAERDTAIEAGAVRPVPEQVADLAAASERFAAAARALPDDRGDVLVRGLSGRALRAGDLPWGRLRELEIHHVDLDVGYGPERWDAAFVARLLPEVVASYAGRDAVPAVTLQAEDTGRTWALGTGGGVTVTGPERALLGWLVGRSAGEALRASGGPSGGPEGGALPVLPAWM